MNAALSPSSLQRLLDLLRQSVYVDRFRNVAIAASRQCTLSISFHYIGRHSQDRDPVQLLHLLETLSDMLAVGMDFDREDFSLWSPIVRLPEFLNHLESAHTDVYKQVAGYLKP